MYNSVRLQTPRGSGTSGHVQASKFLAKPQPSSSTAAAAICGTRKPNRDILEHDRKRQLEVRLLELRDALEEQGYSEHVVEERITEAWKAAGIEAEGATEEGIPPLSGQEYGL